MPANNSEVVVGVASANESTAQAETHGWIRLTPVGSGRSENVPNQPGISRSVSGERVIPEQYFNADGWAMTRPSVNIELERSASHSQLLPFALAAMKMVPGIPVNDAQAAVVAKQCMGFAKQMQKLYQEASR